MKTKEFERIFNIEAEKLGLYIITSETMVNLYKGKAIIAMICKTAVGFMNTYYSGFAMLSEEERIKLLKIITQYIATPLEER